MPQLELHEGEIVQERCKAGAAIGLRSLWQGDLWVTNQRVAWRRHGWTPPYPKPDAFDIPIDSIHEVAAKDALGAFAGLNIHTTTKRYHLIPYRGILAFSIWMNGKLAKQLALAINDARLHA
jgi:hypothetical protein